MSSSPSIPAFAPGHVVLGRYRLGDSLSYDLPGAHRVAGFDTVLGREVELILTEGLRSGDVLEAAGRSALLAGSATFERIRRAERDGAWAILVLDPCPFPSLAAHGALAPDAARTFVESAAQGLELARNRGLYHGALRPACVRITPSGPLITGLAWEAELVGYVGEDAHERARRDAQGLIELYAFALTGRYFHQSTGPNDPFATLGEQPAHPDLWRAIPSDMRAIAHATLTGQDTAAATAGAVGDALSGSRPAPQRSGAVKLDIDSRPVSAPPELHERVADAGLRAPISPQVAVMPAVTAPDVAAPEVPKDSAPHDAARVDGAAESSVDDDNGAEVTAPANASPDVIAPQAEPVAVEAPDTDPQGVDLVPVVALDADAVEPIPGEPEPKEPTATPLVSVAPMPTAPASSEETPRHPAPVEPMPTAPATPEAKPDQPVAPPAKPAPVEPATYPHPLGPARKYTPPPLFEEVTEEIPVVPEPEPMWHGGSAAAEAALAQSALDSTIAARERAAFVPPLSPPSSPAASPTEEIAEDIEEEMEQGPSDLTDDGSRRGQWWVVDSSITELFPPHEDR